MERLTRLQVMFLMRVCFLLFLQLLILLVVVWSLHTHFPKQVCLMTCGFWLDLFLFLAISIGLIIVSQNMRMSLSVRYAAFLGFSVLLSYIIGLQYNRIAMSTRKDKKTAQTFFKAVAFVSGIFILNLFLLPFTMKYMEFLTAISVSLTTALVGLILWGLFVGKGLLVWISISLIVFLGLLMTDLNRLVHGCKKANSPQCDPLNGASILYTDLVNILQDIFILLNARHR